MEEKPKSIITANASEKVDYALGAISWWGWYQIVLGILEIFGLDPASRRNKRFRKHLKETNYKHFFKKGRR
jgi:hypothetical protein